MNTQKGFAHVVLIIFLVVALIGALGFVYWQNFMNKQAVPTKTTVSPSKTQSSNTGFKDYAGKSFSISYPSNATIKEQSYVGIAEHADLTRETTDSQIALQISIAVYDSKYDNVGEGVPSTHEYLSVKEWYQQQGAEVSGGTDGDFLMAYNYKLMRERGQTNRAAIYILKDTTLYKITLHEGDGVQLKDLDPQGLGATYNFSSEIKKILASFQII